MTDQNQTDDHADNSAEPDQNLVEALLEQTARNGGSAAAAVEFVAHRERRRVRRWAIATIALWLLTAVYFVALLGAYLVFVHPVLNEFLTNQEYRQGDLTEHARVIITGLMALMYWPALLLLAAGCTIMFILATRRATLRQIQISLAEISTQLKAVAVQDEKEP